MSMSKKPAWMTSKSKASDASTDSDVLKASDLQTSSNPPSTTNAPSTTIASSSVPASSDADSEQRQAPRRPSAILSMFGSADDDELSNNLNNKNNIPFSSTSGINGNINSAGFLFDNASPNEDYVEAWEVRADGKNVQQAVSPPKPPPKPPSTQAPMSAGTSNVSASTTAPSTATKMCEACVAESHIATHMCVECSEYMCATVADCHCKTKFTKDHHVNALPNYSPASRAAASTSSKGPVAPSGGGGRRASIMKFGSEKNKVGDGTSARKCSVHLVKVIELCCLQCQDTPLICQFCVIEFHKDHKVCSIGEISDKRRRDIARVYEQLEEPIQTSKVMIEELGRRLKQLDQDRIAGFAKIDSDFDSIIAALNLRRISFKNEFDAIYRAAANTLGTEKSNTMNHLENATGFQNLAEQLLETGSDLEVCETSKNLCKSINDLCKIFDDARNISHCSFAPVDYVRDVGDAVGAISNPYKFITVSNIKKSNLSQSISMLGNKHSKSPTVQTKSTSKVISSVTLSSPMKGSADSRAGSRSNSPSGISKISKASLSTAASGLVRIKNTDANDQGSAVGKLCHPNGLCLQMPYSDGYSSVYTDCLMYVADESLLKIQVFNVTTGMRIRTLGTNLGVNFSPHGMCILMPDGKINKDPILFVADCKNNKVYAMESSTGNVILTIGSGVCGHEVDQFNHPSGVGILPPSVSSTSSSLSEPLLYVCDSLNHRVQVFNAITGEFFCSIGAISSNGMGIIGSDVGQLNFPMGLCLKPAVPNKNGLGFTDALIYVADKNNHRIQVFNAFTGSFVRFIATGIKGTGPDQLNSPRRLDIICINEKEHLNYLYVADYHNHRIQVFNADTGAHIKVLGSRPEKTSGCHNIDVTSRQKGDGVGQLNCPSDIVAFADTSGDVLVYVAERNNHRIQVLSGEVRVGSLQ